MEDEFLCEETWEALLRRVQKLMAVTNFQGGIVEDI